MVWYPGRLLVEVYDTCSGSKVGVVIKSASEGDDTFFPDDKVWFDPQGAISSGLGANGVATNARRTVDTCPRQQGKIKPPGGSEVLPKGRLGDSGRVVPPVVWLMPWGHSYLRLARMTNPRLSVEGGHGWPPTRIELDEQRYCAGVSFSLVNSPPAP